ncbi:MAG: type II toxin-antitoxin system VapC family toxin [Gammaproteobacteria bacterium]|nr:type II toxin-antitoxin system VapC family toxin [Gammaproteobacteria bacterium]MDJ0870985.1 type II toxin-antitoxin system VapC family toxin [Gammaproteobacteria bacterium]MDJ0890640.1 type II toxin-antitoxin system VapC family toxin [Gammaproteobacteria bacterium]
MILVDTSVWVDHLRAGDARLVELLESSTVAMHPMVLGELACGNLNDRETLLALWRNLPQLTVAADAEVLFLLDRHRLWGRGIGYLDVHLLTSVSLNPDARLWTRDKRLQESAEQLELAFSVNRT